MAGDTQKNRTWWYFIPSGVAAVAAIVVLPVITRSMPPEDYGAWVLATAYATFASSVSNFGLTAVYERNYFEHRETGRAAGLFWTIVAFVTALTAATLVLTWTFRSPISLFVIRSRDEGSLLFWTTAALCVGSLRSYFLTFFRNTRDARAFAVATVAESALAAMTTVVLAAFMGAGSLSLAWGPLAASTVVLVVLVVRFLRILPPAWDWPALLDSLRISAPLTPRIILGVLSTQFDKWAIGLISSPVSVASYAIGQRLAQIVFTFATAIENAFQPRTYSIMFDKGIEGSEELGRMLTPYALLTVAAAVTICLIAEEAVAILAPPSYGIYLGVLAATLLTVRYALLFFGKQPQLIYAKKTGLTSALSVASLIISMSAIWLGANRWGPEGVAIGTLGGGVASMIMFMVAGQHYYRIRYQVAPLAMAYGLLAFAAVIVPVMLASGVAFLPRLAVKVVIAAAFVGIAHRAGLMTNFPALRRRSRAP